MNTINIDRLRATGVIINLVAGPEIILQRNLRGKRQPSAAEYGARLWNVSKNYRNSGTLLRPGGKRYQLTLEIGLTIPRPTNNRKVKKI